jgi:hypothetical protein
MDELMNMISVTFKEFKKWVLDTHNYMVMV